MKKSVLFTCCIILFSQMAWTQPLKLGAEKDYPPNFFDFFLSNGQRSFYFSPDGSRLFMNSDLRYQLIDASNGEIIAEGNHLSKVNSGVNNLFNLVRNRSFDRDKAMERARFDEGTEYLVLPDQGVILMLDWNTSSNVVKAIDLQTGEVAWTVDRYRYSADSRSQFVDLILGMANAGRLQRETPQEIARKNARLQGFGDQAFIAADATPAARGFFTPLDGTGLCLLKVQDRYIALDVKTGDEAWVYDQRKLNIGFSSMSEDGALVIVNFNSSYFQANERLILKIDPKTGKEIWTANHVSNFREGRTFLAGDRLVCDYYGAEVFDLKTGKRVLLSIDERTIKTQNTMTALYASDASGGRGTQSIASPSVVQGDYLYASTFSLGKRKYANDGSSKPQVQKYDLRTGERAWESDKLKAGTDLSYADEQYVYMRRGQAFGQSALIVLDAKTGKIAGETDKIDGFVYKQGANDVLTEQSLFRGGRKNIYMFSVGSWELVDEYPIKSLGVGAPQVICPSDKELMAIGVKGLAFFGQQTQASQAIETGRITGSFWNADHGFIFTEKNTQAVDLSTQRVAAELPFTASENTCFMFSPDGKHLAVIRNQRFLRVYQN